MAQFSKTFYQDLNDDVEIRQLGSIVFNADDLSNIINVVITEGGEPATLGGTVVGACIRPDGSNIPITNGTISGNTVTMTLTAACFTFIGQIGIGIQIVSGGTKTTVFKAIYNVERFDTDNTVDPSGTITLEVSDLIDDIETAIASIPADYTDLLATVAPNFSTEAAYSAGSYVWYDGALYMFIKDHAAGSWSASEVKARTIGNALTRVDYAPTFKNGYTNVSGSTIGDFSESSGYVTAIIPVHEGDVVAICGAGGGAAARLYALADDNGTFIENGKAAANTNLNGTLTIPAGATQLVFNAGSTSTTYPPSLSVALNIPRMLQEIHDLQAAVTDIQLALVEIYELIGE